MQQSQSRSANAAARRHKIAQRTEVLTDDNYICICMMFHRVFYCVFDTISSSTVKAGAWQILFGRSSSRSSSGSRSPSRRYDSAGNFLLNERRGRDGSEEGGSQRSGNSDGFDMVDTNRDGYIDRQEYALHHGRQSSATHNSQRSRSRSRSPEQGRHMGARSSNRSSELPMRFQHLRSRSNSRSAPRVREQLNYISQLCDTLLDDMVLGLPSSSVPNRTNRTLTLVVTL